LVAQVLMKHARTPVERADFAVPTPPTDNEKYWYMGRQHRWLLLAQAASFILIAYSIARFATADTRLLLFLVPMSLYMITLCISLLSSARKKRTSLADHLARVRSYAPEHYPSVDVFLPTAGEPLDVLQNTYSYIQHLEWAGRLRVYVLDDAARPEVQGAAEEAGFTYLSRPDRGRLKKAGNLRFGYEHSDGDFIAIFDADFAPRADYLQELMPYFDDAEVGILQSPQFFDARRAWPGCSAAPVPPRNFSTAGSSPPVTGPEQLSASAPVRSTAVPACRSPVASPRSGTPRTSTPAST